MKTDVAFSVPHNTDEIINNLYDEYLHDKHSSELVKHLCCHFFSFGRKLEDRIENIMTFIKKLLFIIVIESILLINIFIVFIRNDEWCIA